MKRLIDVLKNEEGIETLEWIAMGALMLAIALVVYGPNGGLQKALTDTVTAVATKLGTL